MTPQPGRKIFQQWPLVSQWVVIKHERHKKIISRVLSELCSRLIFDQQCQIYQKKKTIFFRSGFTLSPTWQFCIISNQLHLQDNCFPMPPNDTEFYTTSLGKSRQTILTDYKQLLNCIANLDNQTMNHNDFESLPIWTITKYNHRSYQRWEQY